MRRPWQLPDVNRVRVFSSPQLPRKSGTWPAAQFRTKLTNTSFLHTEHIARCTCVLPYLRCISRVKMLRSLFARAARSHRPAYCARRGLITQAYSVGPSEACPKLSNDVMEGTNSMTAAVTREDGTTTL
jgi:hypothetical protein